MEHKNKLIADSLDHSDENLRKQAKKLVRQKNLINKRPTHLFMHEKSLTDIVRMIYFICIILF